jgi:hypothetical protein
MSKRIAVKNGRPWQYPIVGSKLEDLSKTDLVKAEEDIQRVGL